MVVVGGGHNGLVAAAYLGRAGRSVLVLERAAQVGGAAVSQQVFEGVDVRLSAYSYLVSLLPDRIVSDLGLEIRLADRSVASYTAATRAGRSTGPSSRSTSSPVERPARVAAVYEATDRSVSRTSRPRSLTIRSGRRLTR